MESFAENSAPSAEKSDFALKFVPRVASLLEHRLPVITYESFTKKIHAARGFRLLQLCFVCKTQFSYM